MPQSAPVEGIAAAPEAGVLPLTRLLLVLTTSAWRPPPELGSRLAEHLGNLDLSGWCVRQAFLRNYLLWRNGRQYRGGQPILVLPRFAGHAPRRALAVLVLADIMASERRAARHKRPNVLLERQLALSVAETGLEPADLTALAETLLVRAIERHWLL